VEKPRDVVAKATPDFIKNELVVANHFGEGLNLIPKNNRQWAHPGQTSIILRGSKGYIGVDLFEHAITGNPWFDQDGTKSAGPAQLGDALRKRLFCQVRFHNRPVFIQAI